MPSSKAFSSKKNATSSTITQMRKFLERDKNACASKASGSKASTRSGERCEACRRMFRDVDHLAKHKRGALCRRLLQRTARRHRKMALAGQTRTGAAGKGHLPVERTAPQQPTASAVKRKSRPVTDSLMYKPYQCTMCGARFYDKVNVEMHLERQHNTSQQLWVEISKARDTSMNNDSNGIGSSSCGGVQGIRVGGEAGESSSVQFNINTNNICLDISNSNNNASRSIFSDNDRLKCLDCNTTFQSENQLNEHKRNVHNNVPLSIDLNISHTVLHQIPSGAPNRTLQPSYIGNNALIGGAGSDGAMSVQATKNNMTRMDPTGGNLPFSHQIAPSSYILPTPYFNNDPSTSMQQPFLHPHTSYLPPHQHQPAVYHQHSQQQHHHQQQHLPGTTQHHEQDVAMTAQSHNALLESQHSGVSLTPLHHQHPHSLTQFAGMNAASDQNASASVQLSTLNNNPAVVSHTSNLPIVNTTETILLNTNNNAVNNTANNSSVHGTNTLNAVVAEQCPVSGVIPPVTSNRANINTVSSANVASTSSVTVKTHTYATLGTKWNMCGECGVKFLDLMNLELHVDRKHPKLKILGSVDLGEGTVCFKTGVVSIKGSGGTGSILCKELSKERKLSQRHTCSVCNHRTTSLVTMVDHMLNVHFLTGKSMMDAIVSEGETGSVSSDKPQPSSQQRQQLPTTTNTNARQQHPNEPTSLVKTLIKLQRINKEIIKNGSVLTKEHQGESVASNQCQSCQATFQSGSELIRHRIKDKKHTCVICRYVTCSKKEMTDHIRSEHDGSDCSVVSGDTKDVQSQLTCWRCGVEFKKTGDFIEHLKSHGSLTAKCDKCGKQDTNVANIIIHMTTIHSNYMNKVNISVLSKGKTWTCTYLQTVVGDLVNISPVETSASNRKTLIDSKGTPNKTTEIKGRARTKKLRQIENNKTKRFAKEKSKEKGHDLVKPKAYACSQCRICLHGTESLENHLKDHQNSLCGAESSSLSCLDLLGATAIKRSPSEDGIFPSNSASPDRGGSAAAVVGLEPLYNTCGFKCGECGLTKDSSDLLLNHIQKVHISGNLIHQLMEDNTIKNYPIYIVTPISSM